MNFALNIGGFYHLLYRYMKVTNSDLEVLIVYF